MLQTFKRYSAAIKAAGPDQPILRVRGSNNATLYIVGLNSMDSIDLVTQEQRHGFAQRSSRRTGSTMLLGHFDRLGNANHAAAATYNRARRVWPNRWVLSEKFVNPADAAKYEAEKQGRDTDMKKQDCTGTAYQPIGGGYAYASLRVGLTIRNPSGAEIYMCNPATTKRPCAKT